MMNKDNLCVGNILKNCLNLYVLNMLILNFLMRPPEYTLVVYLPIEIYKPFLVARYVEQIKFQKNKMYMITLLKRVFRK